MTGVDKENWLALEMPIARIKGTAAALFIIAQQVAEEDGKPYEDITVALLHLAETLQADAGVLDRDYMAAINARHMALMNARHRIAGGEEPA